MKVWLYKKLERIQNSLKELNASVLLIRKGMVTMSAFTDAVDRLTTEVEETRGAVDSAITLIQGLATFIRENAGNPVAMNALADKLDQDQADIAASITANPVPPTP